MTEQPGRLHPSRVRTLVVFAAAGLVIGWFGVPVMDNLTGSVPSVPWPSVFALLFAAAVLGGMAWQTWSTLHRRRRPIDPHRAVNLLVLAKASMIVGAVFAGIYLGYAVQYVDNLDYSAPAQRVLRAGVAVAAAVVIVVAGWLLERACIVPRAGDEGEDDETDGWDERAEEGRETRG